MMLRLSPTVICFLHLINEIQGVVHYSHALKPFELFILPYINVNDAPIFCMMSSKLCNEIIPLTLSIPGSSQYYS